MREYQLFIDGDFAPSESGETFESHDPSTGEVVAKVAKGNEKDMDRAIGAARKAFDEGPWPGMDPKARAKIMLDVWEKLAEKAGEIGDLETADAGHTIRNSSLFSVPYSNEFFRYMAEAGGKLDYFRPLPRYAFPAEAWEFMELVPLGVCGQIIPWNFPYMMALWKLGPALATGNTVVLKPALETPVSAMALAEVIAESDIPPGVVNMIPADGPGPGEALVSDARVDKVSFTGSTEVGRRIMQLASSTIKSVTLELGGKGPNILLDDADLDIAIPGSLWATYLHSGQICLSGTRLLVPPGLYDEVVARLVEGAEGMKVGPAADYETDMGPVVNQKQLDTIERYVEMGQQEGAKLLTGGEKLTDGELSKGFFFQPTIFGDVTNDMRIAQEEIFGPVLSVIRYEDAEEAIRIANDTIYGLAAGVWSRDIPRALATAKRIQAGTVWINDWHLVSPAASMGGFKQSGIGREHGEKGLEEYLQTRHVYVSQTNAKEQKFWFQILGL